MDRNILIGAGVFVTVALLAMASLAGGVSFGGFFKAFDKTLSPGEQYERNITVRKYYNVSVRFQKGNSSSYLAFDDNDSTIVLADAAGVEVARMTGVNNGRAYVRLSNYELAAVASVSAYGISDYADVVNQTVNDTVLSFSGTSAYLTVKVLYPAASISGYVTDDLTGEAIVGVAVAAFSDGTDLNATAPLEYVASDTSGRYAMTFELADSMALDVYVEGYEVA